MSLTGKLGTMGLAALLTAGAWADVRVPGIFGTGMVLQRERPIKVWGAAEPGEAVTVALGTNIETVAADAQGAWLATLPALKAGGPLQLIVTGRNRIVFDDVLIGEVWLCSGQSNMGMMLLLCANGKADAAAADFPQIRLYTVPERPSLVPRSDVAGNWTVCSPEAAWSFSGVAFYFGRELYRALNVPVGLVASSVGGSPIEPWTDRSSLESLPYMQTPLAEFDAIFPKVEESNLVFKTEMEAYEKSRDALRALEADEAAAARLAAPETAGDDWKTMNLPQPWEQAGLPDFNGLVWFLKDVELPSDWAGKDLLLNLGPVDEVDVTWFNGVRVGGLGSFTQGEADFWDLPREYRVPGQLVKAGRNTIAVRVIDAELAGGLWGAQPETMRLSLAGGEAKRAIPLAGAWRYKAVAALHPKPKPIGYQRRPTVLFNGMIHPLIPYGIRGVLWCQGESNLGDGMRYYEKMRAMIQGWRRLWLEGDIPFYFVQAAPFRSGADPEALPRFWEVQSAALAITNTGMAVINDLGDLRDGHPKRKAEVGRRLALLALNRTYGFTNLVCSGPVYKSMTVEGNYAIRLQFDQVGGGLISQDGDALSWFDIAGVDGHYMKANAEIEGNTIKVWSDIRHPVAVRYGWADIAEFRLKNREGLPASAFRTHPNLAPVLPP